MIQIAYVACVVPAAEVLRLGIQIFRTGLHFQKFVIPLRVDPLAPLKCRIHDIILTFIPGGLTTVTGPRCEPILFLYSI